MKRIISIAFLSISVFTLLIFNVLPHHHHDNEVCLALEYFEHDCDDCSCQHEDHHEACIAGVKYISSRLSDKIKCTVSSDNNHSSDKFSAFTQHFIAPDLFNFKKNHVFLKTEYGEHVSFHQSATVTQVHCLRGPPSSITLV